MALERAHAHLVAKPWGVSDLRSFSGLRSPEKVGEIWYEREGTEADRTSLLLKLLFTSQPLSIQVHPDDAYAQSTGERNGKTEAWYILAAEPGAEIAIGLKEPVTFRRLRESIDDGSIANLVKWQVVLAGESFVVPAGVIHAIGAGFVLAEIQQRSDITYRLYDNGSSRELHAAQAVSVAKPDASGSKYEHIRVSAEQVTVAACPYFSMNRVVLPAGSSWQLSVTSETWFLVSGGEGRVGPFHVVPGEAVFIQSESVEISVGSQGMVALIAYVRASGLFSNLVRNLPAEKTTGARGSFPERVQ